MEIESHKKYNLFLYSIGLFSCIYFFAFNIIGSSYEFFPGDLGDARFNNYLLEHSYQFFCGNINSFWNAPFIFPEKNIITYSDNLIGSAPFYSLFRLIGQDRETSFQNWFIVMTALNYTSCYILLKYLFKNSYAAVLGAIIFTSSIALQAQIGHAQTIPRFPIPLAILFGLLFTKELNPKYFFLMLLMLSYQLYCGIYLGFLLIIPITLLIVTSIIIKRNLYFTKIKEVRWLSLITVTLVINAIFIAILLLPYKERADLGGLYLYEDIVTSVPTLKSYFYSNSGSILWGKLEHIADDYLCYWDYRIFPGGVATLSIVFCLYMFLKSFNIKRNFNENNYHYLILFFMCSFTFLFFIRVNNLSLYKILFNIPGFASMRALQRIINIELVFYAAATAFFFKYFLQNKKIYKNFVIFIFLLSIVIIDNKVEAGGTHRTKKNISQDRISILVDKMKMIPKGSIISYEPDTMYSHPNDYQIDAMLASQSLLLKCLNGYTATSPNEYYLYWGKPNEESRIKWLKYKGALSEKIFVIH